MKKQLALVALLLMTFQTQAQWGWNRIKGNGNTKTETRNLSTYDEVAIAGSFDVFLVAGTEGKITIEAEENLMEYIITEVDGDALKIRIKKGYNLSTSRNHGIIITVPFEDLDEVSLSGSGDVVAKDLIEASNFKCSVAGSGDMTLRLDAQRVKGSVAGSGDLFLEGKTQDVDLKVAGSGDIHAMDLKATNAEASIAGSGDISLYCDGGTLKAAVAGSGDIEYRGNPAKEDTKVAGSGSISN